MENILNRFSLSRSITSGLATSEGGCAALAVEHAEHSGDGGVGAADAGLQRGAVEVEGRSAVAATTPATEAPDSN